MDKLPVTKGQTHKMGFASINKSLQVLETVTVMFVNSEIVDKLEDSSDEEPDRFDELFDEGVFIKLAFF